MAEKKRDNETPNEWNERRELRSTEQTLGALFGILRDKRLAEHIYELLRTAFAEFKEFLKSPEYTEEAKTGYETFSTNILTGIYQAINLLKQISARELTDAYASYDPSSSPKGPGRLLGTILGDILSILSIFQGRFQKRADNSDGVSKVQLSHVNIAINDVITLLECSAKDTDLSRINQMKTAFLDAEGQRVLQDAYRYAMTLPKARTEENQRQTVRLTNIPSAFWSITGLNFEITTKGRTFEQVWNSVINLLMHYSTLENEIAELEGTRPASFRQLGEKIKARKNLMIVIAHEMHLLTRALSQLSSPLLERLAEARMLSAVTGDIYTILSLAQKILQLPHGALEGKRNPELQELNRQTTEDMLAIVKLNKKVAHKTKVTEIEDSVRRQAKDILDSVNPPEEHRAA